MKAVIYKGPGDPSVIALVEVPAPALKPGQIRIAVRASGLNRADLMQRRGQYPPPPGESSLPGMEVAGDVVGTAPDARRYGKGDRVMALLPSGGYAEEACVPEGLALPLPEKLSYAQGAAIPETYFTAHHNLFHLAGLRPGQSALVHAGASGVGTSALQLLRLRDIRAFATAGSPQKVALCQELGAVGIDYKKEKFADVVAQRTNGRGVEAILDPVGGSYLEEDLKCLAVGGCVVVIGTLGGKDARLDLSRLMRARGRVVGSTLRNLPLQEKEAVARRFEKDFSGDLAAGRLTPVMDRTYPAAEAKAAQERMEANLNGGKIVLTWS